MPNDQPGSRAVVVAGLRTPFAKAGTVFRDNSASELARHCTRELLYRTELAGDQVDEVIYGQVVSSPLVPNVAREVSLLPQFPKTIPAYTLNRACASSAQAVANAADQILAGRAAVVLAGGVEMLSNVPIMYSRKFARVLQEAARAKTLGKRLGAFASLRPRDFKPVTPAIAEPSTGKTMGESAEKMAKENGIGRVEQDEYAIMSHHRAAAAEREGWLAREIAPWFAGSDNDQVIKSDNLIRPDTSLEALSRLKPVFDRRHGTVTAGNSSPLTDGAASVLVMNEQKALSLGYQPLTAVRSHAVAAVDPGWQLLMGPAFAVPMALERAGLSWRDIGVFEIHEAFSAQVLSNVQAWESQQWAERLGLGAPVGEVDWERTNIMGGSIALGHPFAATGARLITTLSHLMVERGEQFGLLSICAQGGMGFAMVLENVQ